MEDIFEKDSSLAQENGQEIAHYSFAEKPCKASKADEDNSSDAADSSAAADASPAASTADVADEVTATPTGEETGLKLYEFDLNSSASDELPFESTSTRGHPHSPPPPPPPPLVLPPPPPHSSLPGCSRSNETDVDDIMLDVATESLPPEANGDCRSSATDDKIIPTGTADDEDDDDDDMEKDMKELLRFKRQNSRDYLDQAPIDGLLEGIAEEPEEEVAKEIEEEYDSVVIKDEEEEEGGDEEEGEEEEEEEEGEEEGGSGSGSDAAKDGGTNEKVEPEIDPSTPVVDVVTTDVATAVTATIVDVGDREDEEAPATDDVRLAEPTTPRCEVGLEKESESSSRPSLDCTETSTRQVGDKPEEEEGNGHAQSAPSDSQVEPMDTSLSPSSSSSSADENAAATRKTVVVDEATCEPSTATETEAAGVSENRNHDYVNIGLLDQTDDDDGGREPRAARAEISDEDFSFEPPDSCCDEPSSARGSSAERQEANYDYVNVDTIRANKRLVSRLIHDGNDEEFERLEAEIKSKLEDEDDSDYCVPKPLAVAVATTTAGDDSNVGRRANGSVMADENENLSSSDHPERDAVSETDEPSAYPKPTSSPPPSPDSDFNRPEERAEEDEPLEKSTLSVVDAVEMVERGKGVEGRAVVRENGTVTSTAETSDDDDDFDRDYKRPSASPQAAVHSQNQSDRFESKARARHEEGLSAGSSSLPSPCLAGHQSVKKSSLRAGEQPGPASPLCESSSSYSSRTNDILPEAGSVKALVAQWQQMESKRWSRKDEMKNGHNGAEAAESRGMNRSRSCGPLPRKIRVLSPDGTLDDEGRRITDWTVVGGSGGVGEPQEQYNSQPSLTRAMLVKFERLDYETSSASANQAPPAKKTFKWEVKETKTLNRPGFLAH